MTVVALVFTCGLALAPGLIPCGLILWVCTRLRRAMPLDHRALRLAGIATLLLRPVRGPATIAVLPLSRGVLPGVSLATPSGTSLVDTPGITASGWYLVAVPATAAIAYGIIQHVLSNDSSRPKPLRGSAGRSC